MAPKMPRAGAAVLAVGLAFGSVTGGVALSASAATPVVDRQTVVSFDGRPDVSSFNTDGVNLDASGLTANERVTIALDYARAATPNAFSNYQTQESAADATGHVRLFATPFDSGDGGSTLPDGAGAFAAGDVVRAVVTPATSSPYTFTYIVPAGGGVDKNAPVVLETADTTVTPAEALSGIDIGIPGVDPSKKTVVTTFITRAGDPVPEKVAVERQYLDATNTFIQTTVHGWSEVDDTVALEVGDKVSVDVELGGTVNTAPDLEITIADEADVPTDPTDPTNPTDPGTPATPAGSFAVANPTASQLRSGVDYNFTGLNPAVKNVAGVYLDRADADGGFENITTLDIGADSIENDGSARANFSAFYETDDGVINTLQPGDVFEVRLSVDGVERVLTSYTIAGAVTPVVPTDPTVPVTPVTPGVTPGTNTPNDGIAPADVTNATPTGEFNTGGYDDGTLEAYENCEAAQADGKADLTAKDPGFTPALDGDNDGVGCEDNISALAKTGASDDRTVKQNILLAAGGSLFLGLSLMGAKVLRNRKADELV